MTTRVKGHQVYHLDDAPAFLQDMKDGEMRVAEDGVYVRYGPQIRRLLWDETPVSTTTTTTTTTSSTVSTTSSTASSTSTTVPLMWVEVFGPSYWGDAGLTVPIDWDVGGERYEAGGGGSPGALEAVASWATGLRPAAIRFNYGPSHEVTIKDTNGDTIGYSGLYASGDPIPLTFGSYDLDQIYFNGAGINSDLTITNIEVQFEGWATTVVNIDHGSFAGTMSKVDSVWSNVHDATDADTAGPPWGVPYGYLARAYFDGANYGLSRAIAEFDLSSIPDGATILSAELILNYGGPAFTHSPTWIIQEAIAGLTFEVGDFDSFTGPILGTGRCGSAGWSEVMWLTGDGVNAIQAHLADNKLQVMFREYYYDYQNSAPWSGANYAAHYEFDQPITLRVTYTL